MQNPYQLHARVVLLPAPQHHAHCPCPLPAEHLLEPHHTTPSQTKPRRAARLHVQPLLPQLGAAASCSWPPLLLAGHPQAAGGQREPHVCSRLPAEPLRQGHPEPPCRRPGDWESWRRGGQRGWKRAGKLKGRAAGCNALEGEVHGVLSEPSLWGMSKRKGRVGATLQSTAVNFKGFSLCLTLVRARLPQLALLYWHSAQSQLLPPGFSPTPGVLDWKGLRHGKGGNGEDAAALEPIPPVEHHRSTSGASMSHFKGLVRAFQTSQTAVLNGSKYHTTSLFFFFFFVFEVHAIARAIHSFLLHPCEPPCWFS